MAREDGAMLGPYNPMLHFPQFGTAAWGMNTALSQHTVLPKPVHELVILVTRARFSARYELYAHEFTAEKAGLSPAKIAALAAGARPGDLAADEVTAFDVATALTRGAQLPESTYQATIKAFGETGTGELIFLIGFYCLISVLLNGFDVPVPKRDSDTEGLQGGLLMSNFDLNRREIIAGLLSVGGAMMIDPSPAFAESLL